MSSSRFNSLVDLLLARSDHAGDEVAYGFLGTDGRLVESWTYDDLFDQSARVASAVAERVEPGERVLLLFAPGLPFLAGFFGCLRAGAIAVPVFPPSPAMGERGFHRLLAVAENCTPQLVLSTSDLLAHVMGAGAEVFGGLEAVAVDRLPKADGPVRMEGGLAFLQYTSGSTSTPKGVRVTHENLLANLSAIYEVCGGPDQGPGVSWLPVQHDMGLIEGVLHPLFRKQPGYLMAPATFLARPATWLEAMSRLGGTNAASPDFGYQLCVRRTTIEERARLDLSRWTMAANGSEPIRADTIESFCQAFEVAGFQPEAFFPAYGLAENTLLASASRKTQIPRILEVDAPALNGEDRIASPSSGETSRKLVSCGTPVDVQEIAIVDPKTLLPRAEGRVGEIWLRGPSRADGYWNHSAESSRVFGASLEGDADPWLRTGDLGALHCGELYVTGRIKDVIIVRGRKLYPQDIESSVEGCHPRIRPGGIAAFAWSELPGEAEGIGLLCEIQEPATGTEQEIERAIRSVVSREHDAPVKKILVVPPRTVPKTTSGKIQRHACAALVRSHSAVEVTAH